MVRRVARHVGAICGSIVLIGGGLPGTATAQSTCGDLKSRGLGITNAQYIEAGPLTISPPGQPPSTFMLPAHCRVDGIVEQRTGVNGVEYGIRYALAMPVEWTGRFLFQGGGGLNGAVNPPIGGQAAGTQAALERGFVVVSTDTGHRGAVFDGSFFADQQAALNFLWLANAKVTDIAKVIIDAYYSRFPEHSYFVGCSTGGREAMIMSQRYPYLFDGLVSGAPAMRTGFSNLGMRSVAVALGTAAQRDANGAAILGSALSESDKKLIVDSLLKTCDADDGLADGLISDPLACDFDPADLTCASGKNDSCLTPAQASAVKKALSGPKTASGRQVYPGYLYDTGITTSAPRAIPGVLNGSAGPVGPAVAPSSQDVDAEVAEVVAAASTLGDTASWTNLSSFSGHGGKLLFYHGVSDPWFSSLDTVQYYERLAAASGGTDATRDWSRLFLVPGMGHCGGGAALDQFDLLSAIVDWVENGRAPDRVVATGDAFPERSRPLCPHPQHAHYKGSGNPEDAASFDCR